ncbi:MAG: sialidase family protein, partial [Woeseiaceae bacterium]
MTSQIRIAFVLLMASLFAAAASAQEPLNIGANVNMVTGNAFPNGDPFLRQQNEPSVAFSSRNSLHLLSGANDYRAVDVPGLPGGRETGDSWLSYFWSTNGGATWKSTLIPGYPQDPDCQGPNPPTLCGYAAGADPVVRAGVNGMFYYSGIVFERGDPSRSAIFVSRFIDLNNDEGGDPIRFLDTTIIDANNDGAVFLDKSWIGVDIPRAATGTAITDTFSVTQRGGATVDQTVACGNIYVGYAAIGGEDTNLRSEIRLATSADCGNSWDIQSVSETDTLNQGANIAIHPDNGTLHVVWRRFDTVESFLGISPAGCPASPASWRKDSDWPVSSIDLAGTTYTEAEARNLLGRKHRGDESIKLSQNIIAAKLNLLTGGGDPAPGFNPWNWAQALTALVDEADAWLLENGLGSKPKQADKKEAKRLKREIQQLLQGSGTCVESDGGSNATFTGATNAIMAVSSDDFGETFSEPAVISESNTFDQGSTTFSFRTTAYPSVAADDSGRIYVAWAARGFATIRGDEAEGDARIVLSASTDGINWSAPYAIDEPNRQGHQIKPSMLFAGGQLTLVFYDFRQDVSNIFEGFVIDLPEENRLRHTVDVRVATALPAALPVFTDYSLLTGSNEPANPSSSASRYTFVATADGASGETLQVEYMVPNFPMFADGTTPFIGDYVDIAAPNLINDGGTWRFASQPGDVQVWQAVWSDNRDVIPPPDGDWGKYVAPITEAQTSFFDPEVVIPACTNVTFPDALPQFQAGALYTGTRNQNVYSASLSNGVIVAAPGNNRPLGFDDFGAPLERG